jgi:putative transposase
MIALDARLISAALGVTKSAVKKRAQREGWPYIEQTCRGGRRRMYPLDGLPAGIWARLVLLIRTLP